MFMRRAFLVHKTNTIAARLSRMLWLVVVAAVVVPVSFMGGTPGDAIAKSPGEGEHQSRRRRGPFTFRSRLHPEHRPGG